MKKKEESEKKERKKEVVCMAVATVTRQISTLISGVRKYRLLHDFMDSSRKTKIGIRRKHTSFLRRSDIGQFVTCDEPHFTMATPRRRQYRV